MMVGFNAFCWNIVPGPHITSRARTKMGSLLMIYYPYHVKKAKDHLGLLLFLGALYSPSFFYGNPTRSSQTLDFVKKLPWSLLHPFPLLWIKHFNVRCMVAHHIVKALAGERGFSVWWLMHLGKSCVWLFTYISLAISRVSSTYRSMGIIYI